MADTSLPALEQIVQQVVEKNLKERDFPAQLSTETVRQFHVGVFAQYCQSGRKERLWGGTIKKAVRAYLEGRYDYIQEYVDNPLKPGRKMIESAYYERKKERE